MEGDQGDSLPTRQFVFLSCSHDSVLSLQNVLERDVFFIIFILLGVVDRQLPIIVVDLALRRLPNIPFNTLKFDAFMFGLSIFDFIFDFSHHERDGLNGLEFPNLFGFREADDGEIVGFPEIEG